MKKLIFTVIALVFASVLSTREIPFKYEEITAPDFVKAMEKSAKTCVIPTTTCL